MNDVLNILRNGLLKLATSAAMGLHYTSWDDQTVRKELENAEKEMTEAAIKADRFNEFLANSTQEEIDALSELGFSRWDDPDDEGYQLRLIPLYAVSLLDPELEVTSIMDSVKKLKDADTDIRFGCIAYGVKIKLPMYRNKE